VRLQLEQAAGAGGDILGNLEQQRNELRDRVNQLATENEKFYQDALERTFGESFRRLADIITKTVENEVRLLEVRLEEKRTAQQGQGRELGR
jgi:hypothetical protein